MNRHQRRSTKNQAPQKHRSASQLDALILLAQQHSDAGRFREAAIAYRAALAIKPNFPEVYQNLGYAMEMQHDDDEAAKCYKQALLLKPALAEAHYSLGNILDRQGKLDEATTYYRQALALKPDYAKVWLNLGGICEKQNKLHEAAAFYERALAIKPDFADAFNSIGNIRVRQVRFDEAIAYYKRALSIRPDYAEACFNLGNIFNNQDMSDEAATYYEKAVSAKPDYVEAYHNLGGIRQQQGKLDRAEECYELALGVNPDFTESYYNRSAIRTYKPNDNNLAALQTLATKMERLPAAKKMYAHFAIAKALEDIGDYAGAFEHWLKGNAIKRQDFNYDEAADVKLFSDITATFRQSFRNREQKTGDLSPSPIFIVGMPRSGSTLVEQIIASHPQVHGAGERNNLAVIANNTVLDNSGKPLSYPHYVPALGSDGLRELGRLYLASLPPLPKDKNRITDKELPNFLYVGLIRMILPNAKIIHTMRDPMDTCISCFSILFKGEQKFTYDLAELGRYYRRYSGLMDHWRSILPPGAMLDFSYEGLLADFEAQAKQLIAYCGLPWDDRCLSFHENKRIVRTASSVQVRQPLYRTSLQRWRRYEPYLGPLLAELGTSLSALK